MNEQPSLLAQAAAIVLTTLAFIIVVLTLIGMITQLWRWIS